MDDKKDVPERMSTDSNSPDEKRQRMVNEEVKDFEELIDGMNDIETLRKIAKMEVKSRIRKNLILQDERDAEKEKKMNAEKEKELMEEGLRAAMAIPKMRKKIERLQTAFEMTAGISAAEMEKVVMAHFKTVKSDTLKTISSKLDEIEKSTRKRVMEYFNAQSTQDLLNSTLTEWKNDTTRKILDFDGFDEATKTKIAELLAETKIILRTGCEKMTDQYPTLLNSRFIMWVYFFLRCPDPRIQTMRAMIEKDESLNLYSFCIGVAELYTITSSIFHPASLIFCKTKLSVSDVVNSLEHDYEISELSILHTAEILLSVDTANAPVNVFRE